MAFDPTGGPPPRRAVKAKTAPRPKAKKVAPIHVVGAKPPSAIPHAKATGFVPPSAAPSYIQQAQQAVNPVYAPQYAGVDAQVALDHSQAAAQAAQMNAWAQNQAKLLAKIAPQIQGIYGQAASNDAVFGKGYSDGLQQAQNTNSGDINKILAQNGAPAGQMQNPGSDAADVLYGLGGQIPASTLNAQGAAFASAASFLPATALGRGQLAAQDAFQQGNLQAQKDELQRYGIDANKANAVLGRSDQLQSADVQAKQAAQDYAQKQQAAQFQERLAIAQYGTAKDKADFDKWYKTQYLNQRGQAISASNARADANLTLAEKRLNLQAASVFGIDPATGQPTLAARQATQRAQQTKAKVRKGGYTAGQLQKLRAQANSAAQAAYQGYWADPSNPHQAISQGQLQSELNAYRQKHGVDATPAELGLGFYKASYQETLMNLVNSGVPLTYAQQALNRYWTKPGQHYGWEAPESGRPRRSLQQRRRAKGK